MLQRLDELIQNIIFADHFQSKLFIEFFSVNIWIFQSIFYLFDDLTLLTNLNWSTFFQSLQSTKLHKYFIFFFYVVKEYDYSVDELSCIISIYKAQICKLGYRLSDEIVEKVELEIIEHVLSKETIEDNKCSV